MTWSPLQLHTFRDGGVLVWRGIMLCSRTDLHMFKECSVTDARYSTEIILPSLGIFRVAVGHQFLLMDDNPLSYRDSRRALGEWIYSIPGLAHEVLRPKSYGKHVEHSENMLGSSSLTSVNDSSATMCAISGMQPNTLRTSWKTRNQHAQKMHILHHSQGWSYPLLTFLPVTCIGTIMSSI